MKVLVIGSGGREHALVWKLRQSPLCDEIWCAPGNAGIREMAITASLRVDATAELVHFAADKKIDLVVVGPENPLAAGLADVMRVKGVPVFGPSKEAAQIESSKSFARDLMARHNIPTPKYATFTEPDGAKAFVRELESEGRQSVVKANGLAAGKGAIVTSTTEEAGRAIDLCMIEKAFGAAGATVVIEERLEGPELSILAVTDGERIVILPPAQDHKRVGEGDTGPNTGGMGAYSPAPVVTPDVHARVMREIIAPTLAGMAAEGLPYTGFLYAGLMIDDAGQPRVVEFNCRMGDPETQPIMMRLKSDLGELVEAALAGRLDQAEAEWDRRFALGVVLAAAGYPDNPRKGDAISGLPDGAAEDAHVFHAGTAEQDGRIVTAGGRVLCVTALGDNVRTAQKRAYELTEGIAFDGCQYRRDIGHRALSRRG